MARTGPMGVARTDPIVLSANGQGWRARVAAGLGAAARFGTVAEPARPRLDDQAFRPHFVDLGGAIVEAAAESRILGPWRRRRRPYIVAMDIDEGAGANGENAERNAAAGTAVKG